MWCMTEDDIDKFEHMVSSPFWSPTLGYSIVINDFGEIRTTRSDFRIGALTEYNIDILYEEWKEDE